MIVEAVRMLDAQETDAALVAVATFSCGDRRKLRQRHLGVELRIRLFFAKVVSLSPLHRTPAATFHAEG